MTTKAERDYVNNVANSTNKALQFISRGRVWIEYTKDNLRITGKDKKDCDVLQQISNLVDKKKEFSLPAILDRFGWDYEKKGDELTGEGVLVFALFQWLMADIDDKDMNEMIQKLLPKLKLTLLKEFK